MGQVCLLLHLHHCYYCILGIRGTYLSTLCLKGTEGTALIGLIENRTIFIVKMTKTKKKLKIHNYPRVGKIWPIHPQPNPALYRVIIRCIPNRFSSVQKCTCGSGWRRTHELRPASVLAFWPELPLIPRTAFRDESRGYFMASGLARSGPVIHRSTVQLFPDSQNAIIIEKQTESPSTTQKHKWSL